MRTTGVLALALATITLPAVAQTPGHARVIKAMSGRWIPALCQLHNDFRTSGSNTYLKSATEQPDPKKAEGLVKNAEKSASDAIAASPNNAAGYYYLGRAELVLGDIAGADTSFTRAATLSPDCEGELKGFRQTAWLALVLPSTEYLKANQFDSAMMVLRAAATISRDYPQGYFNMAVAFVNTNQPDSGIAYFKLAQGLAIKGGNDPLFTAQRDRATLNLGMLYAQANKNKEAADEFKQYLTYQPNDVDAKKRYSDALRASGDAAGAATVNQALAASGDMSAGDLVMMGIGYFNEKPPKYTEAADAFQKSLKKEPGQRDVLFNLANMYRDEGRSEPDRDRAGPAQGRPDERGQRQAPREWVPVHQGAGQAARCRLPAAGDGHHHQGDEVCAARGWRETHVHGHGPPGRPGQERQGGPADGDDAGVRVHEREGRSGRRTGRGGGSGTQAE